MKVIQLPNAAQRIESKFAKIYHAELAVLSEPIRTETAKEIGSYMTRFLPPELNSFKVPGDFSLDQQAAIEQAVNGYVETVTASMVAILKELIMLRIQKAICEMSHG